MNLRPDATDRAIRLRRVATTPVHAIYCKVASVSGVKIGLLTRYGDNARKWLFELYGRGNIEVVFGSQHNAGIESIFGGVERLLSGKSIGKVIADLLAEQV